MWGPARNSSGSSSRRQRNELLSLRSARSDGKPSNGISIGSSSSASTENTGMASDEMGDASSQRATPLDSRKPSASVSTTASQKPPPAPRMQPTNTPPSAGRVEARATSRWQPQHAQQLQQQTQAPAEAGSSLQRVTSYDDDNLGREDQFPSGPSPAVPQAQQEPAPDMQLLVGDASSVSSSTEEEEVAPAVLAEAPQLEQPEQQLRVELPPGPPHPQPGEPPAPASCSSPMQALTSAAVEAAEAAGAAAAAAAAAAGGGEEGSADAALVDFWCVLQQTQQHLQELLVDLETARLELELANGRAGEGQWRVRLPHSLVFRMGVCAMTTEHCKIDLFV